jgi:hypothetical protein
MKLYHGSNVAIQEPDFLVLELQFAKGITFQYFFGTKPALKKIKYYGTEY